MPLMQTEPSHNANFDKLFEKLSDKYWRLNNLYYIKDKDGKKIKFKLNWAQEKFHKEKHCRNIILKARQLGFTTYKCIDKLDDVLFNSYLDAGIICHNLEDAEKIFTNKVKFAYDNLPEWLKSRRVPNTDRAGELRFPNNSSISVSAGFRGGTLAGGLHVSEYGKICRKYPEKAREIKSGAVNAVPLGKDCDFESTAEGMDGDFYAMYERAQLQDHDKLTALDYKLHFFPWHESTDYRLNPLGIEIPDELERYFKMLETDHGITLDAHQKAWYYKKSEDEEKMHQEYPSFPDEAFMASGRPVFNREKLAKDIKKAKEFKSELKTFVVKGIDKAHSVTARIFKLPVSGEAYSIGADVAEGLEDGDSSTAAVYNKNFEMMAVYEGKLDPDLFGEFLVELALFYGSALITPELNNHGHATIAAIKRRKYYNVYKRFVQEELGEERLDKIGWLNTSKSKMKMLDDFKAAYRDDSLIIHCEHTLRQMITLAYEEDGNVILNGKDLCVATGLAIEGLSQAVPLNTIGAHQSSSDKTKFKSVTEMLKYNSSGNEESYFD